MNSNDRIMVGWDIGGANIKAVRFKYHNQRIRAMSTLSCPFEIWHDPDRLKMKLEQMGEQLALEKGALMAVTITAELSDAFSTKREGVLYVLDALEQAFDTWPIHVFTMEGQFLNVGAARQSPLLCAATNWLASAAFINTHKTDPRLSDCLFVDIGSTTTDIIPIRKGDTVARGRTDTHRMVSGELLYTGILRTNPNTLTTRIPLDGQWCTLANEYFTSMADIYLILGQITPEAYSCPTADGRDKTLQAARQRLARLVCADHEMLSETQIDMAASFLKEKQVQQIMDALCQVLSGQDKGAGLPIAAAGAGAFLARSAAGRLGLSVIDLGQVWDEKTLAVFPALGVGYLLALKAEKAIR